VCLYVATKLGDLADDMVLVGGLVPSLLIEHQQQSPHVGTTDLDIGLALAILDGERYREMARRLRDAGFAPDKNDDGKPTRQRWRIDEATVDFLIPQTDTSRRGGSIQSLEGDFAALVTPGLELAFRDRERRKLEGRTIRDEKATRDVWVCGPGAFVVLKALAFRSRGENKDAYDLYYLMKHYGHSLADVGARLTPLLVSPKAREALEILASDFTETDGVGPRRVAEFLGGVPDEALQGDVVGLAVELLAACGAPR
jgi:hypothetical protein